jgi:hypothetical protein
MAMGKTSNAQRPTSNAECRKSVAANQGAAVYKPPLLQKRRFVNRRSLKLEVESPFSVFARD